MAAAIALAIVLVVAVAGMSLAMQTQRPTPGQGGPRVARTPPIAPRRVRDRRPASPPVPDPAPAPASAEASGATPKVPELLRSGVPGHARVVNVVDERVVGPVTRSRLTLRVEPEDGESFEATIRHAFPTPAAREAVRIGGTVAVRYDREDHHKVVLDLSS